MQSKYIRKELIDIDGVTDTIKLEQPLPADLTETVSEDSWEAISAQLEGCTRCRLSERRKTIVFGEGNRLADLMFVGEGPGAQEDRTGRPFVGDAGQLLTKMIKAMGYAREDVFIGNIVKCRPPDNRKPFKDETAACIGFIERQIALIKPKVIVTLGETATVGLLNTSSRISQIRGRWQKYQNIKVMPTFHPAYLLRNESAKRDVWNALKLVMAELGKSSEGDYWCVINFCLSQFCLLLHVPARRTPTRWTQRLLMRKLLKGFQAASIST